LLGPVYVPTVEALVDRRPLPHSDQGRAGAVRSALRRAWHAPELRQAVLLVVGLRVALGVVAWLAARGHGLPPDADRSLVVSPGSPLWPLVAPWQRFDALIYQHIAVDGYRHGAAAVGFFPLYPLLMHAGGVVLGGAYALAGLLLNTGLLVAALAVVHRLVAADVDEVTARRTVLYTALAPTAFFFFAPYSESLFLLLAAGTFLAARRGRFVTAGAVGALVTLSRPQGILLLAPLAVEVARDLAARHRAGEQPLRRAHLALLLPPLALVGFYLYATRVVGASPLAAEGYWGGHYVWPWRPLLDSLDIALRQGYSGEILNPIALLLLAAAAVAMWRRLPLSYLAYTVTAMLPMLFRENGGGHPMQSADRFALVVFPAFAVLAMVGRRHPRLHLGLLLLFPLLMAKLLTYYVQGSFVG